MVRRARSQRGGRRRTDEALGEEWFARASRLLDRGRVQDAFSLFLEAAKAGDVHAQVNVGYLYDTGQGVSRSRDQAMLWYRKAARRGNLGAAHNIGTIYRDEGRLRLALRWFEKAAAKGDGDALFEMARLYAGPLEELSKARKLLSRVCRSKQVTEDSWEQAQRLLRSLEQRERLSRPSRSTR